MLEFAFHIVNLYKFYIDNKWKYSLYRPQNKDIEYELFRFRIPARFKHIYNGNEYKFYRDVINDDTCCLITKHLLGEDMYGRDSFLLYEDKHGKHKASMYTGSDSETITNPIINQGPSGLYN